ncbi:MAG: SET domain-containing protein [Patescibacteria group bacterium]|nr:SET domain-containing protein [Patescibacteria group bacterium]
MIKTKLSKSKVHGMGLYADQFIPKGTITWIYSDKYDQSFTKKDVEKMDDITKKQFFKYAYWDKTIKKYVLCFDDQRFINHSSKPNILSTQKKDVASRDIKKGEELLCDYTKFDENYFDNIGFKH